MGVLTIGCASDRGRVAVGDSSYVSPRQRKAVESALKARFPTARHRLFGRGYTFEGGKTYWVPEWATVQPAELGAHSTHLPRAQIYKSAVFLIHWGPEEIGVLVNLGDPDPAIAMSPDFAPPEARFLDSLAALAIVAESERATFTSAVAELYASIMTEGSVRSGACTDACCATELWKGLGAQGRPLNRFEACFEGEHARSIRAEPMSPSN